MRAPALMAASPETMSDFHLRQPRAGINASHIDILYEMAYKLSTEYLQENRLEGKENRLVTGDARSSGA